LAIVEREAGRELKMPDVEDSPEDKASDEDWEEAEGKEIGSGRVFVLISCLTPLEMQKFKRAHGAERIGLGSKAPCK
jgi:hypothetical protein